MDDAGRDPVREKLTMVVDEVTFLDFLAVLADDRRDEAMKEQASPSSPYGPSANGWENGTIEAFLEAAVAWASDSDGGIVQGRRADNPWLRCAEILYAGKAYE